MNKSTKSYEEGNIKSAIKYCDKVLEIDNEFADAYFSRGTLKLNDMQFDQAIADFDSALAIEPFIIAALANRAFARIRKQELGGDRKLFNNSQVTILASKTNKSEMSESDRNSVCKDLTESIF